MAGQRIHLAVFTRPGRAGIFEDIVTLYHATLASLGLDVSVADGALADEAVNVVMGGGLAIADAADQVLRRAEGKRVVVQSEPLGDGCDCWVGDEAAAYRACLQAADQVWDYAPSNVALLRAHGLAHAHLVQPGWCDVLERVSRAAAPTLDVLFYGIRTLRRQQAIRAIAREGLRVRYAINTYGHQRDAMISQATIVLNMHKWENPQLEQFRLAYLLNNDAFVVSEAGDCQRFEGGVVFADLADLPAVCRRWAHPSMAADRAAIASRGRQQLQATNMAAVLAERLAGLGVIAPAVPHRPSSKK